MNYPKPFLSYSVDLKSSRSRATNANQARRAVLIGAAMMAFASAMPVMAQGSTYPDRIIELVVPFAAGGPTDVFARIYAKELSQRLGQSVIVINKPGAGGNIGTTYAARAKPDGYTLMIGTVSTHAFNAALYKSLPFDPLEDFVPIVQIAEVPQILVVPPSLGVKNLKELMALSKAKPGVLNYGSAGTGSSNHISGAMFATMAGLDLVHVPYKGSGPALNDLLAGHLTVFFDALSTTLPWIAQGKLIPIGVASPTRVKQLPNVPTLAEAGLPGYLSYTWNIVFAPKGTPADIVSKINSESNKVMQDPAMQERAQKMGLLPVGNSTPQGTRAYVREEFSKWQPIVKATGAQVD